MFLPSFLFVWLLNPLIPMMKKSTILRNFLDCINVGAVAIMMVILMRMGIESLINWQNITIALLSFMAYFGIKKVNSIWIILGGSLLGFLLSMMS